MKTRLHHEVGALEVPTNSATYDPLLGLPLPLSEILEAPHKTALVPVLNASTATTRYPEQDWFFERYGQQL